MRAASGVVRRQRRPAPQTSIATPTSHGNTACAGMNFGTGPQMPASSRVTNACTP